MVCAQDLCAAGLCHCAHLGAQLIEGVIRLHQVQGQTGAPELVQHPGRPRLVGAQQRGGAQGQDGQGVRLARRDARREAQEPRQKDMEKRGGAGGPAAQRWEAQMVESLVAAPVALPTQTGIDPGLIPERPCSELTADSCPQRQTGGRSHGLRELHEFLTRRAPRYQRAMSSPNTAFTGCSRLS